MESDQPGYPPEETFDPWFNPFMLNGFFYLHSLDRPISIRRGVWLVFIITNSVFNANSVDSDQMTHSAASDLCLHCLPMSLLWDTRLKWVNI